MSETHDAPWPERGSARGRADLLQHLTVDVPENEQRWLDAARAVGAQLREGIVEREAAGASPHAEVVLLREAGLVDLLDPVELGGGGQGWAVAVRVSRIVAQADASVAHVLAYHYTWQHIVATLGTPEAERAAVRGAREGWLWASPGSSRAGLPLLTASGDGYLLDGDSQFATGAPVADRLLVQSVDARSGRRVIVSVDPRAAGVRHHGEWDALGQRRSASTAVAFSGVQVAADDVLAVLEVLGDWQEPHTSLGVLGFQLVFGVLLLGIAEGALTEARDYTRTLTRPAFHSTVEHGHDEPFILNEYGRLVAQTQAVSALIERATAALERAYARGDALTAAERAETAEIIASAKVVSTENALAVASAVFDLTGARATARTYGLDRFWRDARTLSLHDPVAYKRDELGRYFVNGEWPKPSGYR